MAALAKAQIPFCSGDGWGFLHLVVNSCSKLTYKAISPKDIVSIENRQCSTLQHAI